MKEICDKDSCTGCKACACICPKQAIRFVSDEKGFFYPEIDSALCIDCGLCHKVCPIVEDSYKEQLNQNYNTFLFRNDLDIRKKSSSGGAFLYLAQQILQNHGSVYGAKFDEQMQVVHGCAETMEEAIAFCGSKYVQSDVDSVYKLVYKDLSEGREVLFTGTSCQVSGLLSFLEKKNCSTTHLYTQDFVCHGVGSPQFYSEYLKYYEQKYKSRVVKVNFRGKYKKGKFQNMIIDFENGKRHISFSTNEDFFYYHFLNNLILKPACYQCRFAKDSRVSDITLADCFRPREEDQNLDDGYGVSAIYVNTLKGKRLLEAGGVMKKETKLDYYRQPNMKSPTPKNGNYDVFWKCYIENGFMVATKKYGNRNLKHACKRGMIRFVDLLGLDVLIKKIRR